MKGTFHFPASHQRFGKPVDYPRQEPYEAEVTVVLDQFDTPRYAIISDADFNHLYESGLPLPNYCDVDGYGTIAYWGTRADIEDQLELPRASGLTFREVT